MTHAFTQDYFEGNTKSNYGDYATTHGCLNDLSSIVWQRFKPKSICDVAAAYGFVCLWFDGQGVPAVGYDISEFAASRCSLVKVGALPRIPDPGGHDLVTCFECLEHIPEPDVRDSIAELYRLTARKVAITVGTFPEGTTHDPSDLTHCTFHPIEWWQGVVESLGVKRNAEDEEWLSQQESSRRMQWSGRFLVLERP